MSEKEDTGVDFSDGDSLVVDMSGVEEVSFEAIPQGMYNCQIIENEFVFSKSGGNPMWSLSLEVADGEYAGRRLFSHLVWAGKGLGFTKRDLAQIAPELLEAPFEVQDPEIIASLLGRDVRVKVAVRMYEGEKTNNVRGLFAAGGDDGGFG